MESLLKKARECGFDACGVVPVDVLSRERERLERWIGQGFHAGMNYMANNIETVSYTHLSSASSMLSSSSSSSSSRRILYNKSAYSSWRVIAQLSW